MTTKSPSLLQTTIETTAMPYFKASTPRARSFKASIPRARSSVANGAARQTTVANRGQTFVYCAAKINSKIKNAWIYSKAATIKTKRKTEITLKERQIKSRKKSFGQHYMDLREKSAPKEHIQQCLERSWTDIEAIRQEIDKLQTNIVMIDEKAKEKMKINSMISSKPKVTKVEENIFPEFFTKISVGPSERPDRVFTSQDYVRAPNKMDAVISSHRYQKLYRPWYERLWVCICPLLDSDDNTISSYTISTYPDEDSSTGVTESDSSLSASTSDDSATIKK